MNTEKMLDQLSELYTRRDLLNLEKKELLETVLPPEIKEAMNAIDLEYKGKEEIVSKNIADVEEQIKNSVVESGDSVKGEFLHAIYYKGRISWDNAKLEGLMLAFPKISEARKQGNPYTVIKKYQG